MEVTDSRMRSLTLRKNIRRMELDSYFQEKRNQLLSQLTEGEDHRYLINSVQEQERFIDECARELTGQPKIEWLPTISRLHKTLIAFNGEYDQWFSKNIIRNLKDAASVQLQVKGLTEAAVNLLIDLHYCAGLHGKPFASRFIEYEPVIDLVELARSAERPLLARLSCVMLLSKIAGEEKGQRFPILRAGGGLMLAELAKEIATSETSEHIVSVYLQSCIVFLQVHKSSNQIPSHMNLLYSLVPSIHTIFIQKQLREASTNFCLSVLGSIMSVDREHVYWTVYNCFGLPDRLLSLLQHEMVSVRIKTAHVISYFTFCNNTGIISDLYSRNVMEKLWEGHHRFPTNNDYIRTMINALLNSADIPEYSEAIAAHPVGAFIGSQFASSDSQSVLLQALYCLHTILRRVRYATMEQIVSSTDILRVIGLRLHDKVWDATFMVEMVDVLSTLVQRSTSVFHMGNNPIIHQMESRYNIPEVIETIRNETTNKNITASCDILLKRLHDQILGDPNFV